MRKWLKRQLPAALSRGARPASTTDDLPLPEAPASTVRLRRSTASARREIAASRPKNRCVSFGPK
jgi:hypothetical protein